MKRLLLFAAALGVLAGFAPGHASASGHRSLVFRMPAGNAAGANLSAAHLRARSFEPATHVSVAQAMAQAKAATTVKMFTRSVTDGSTFQYTMIGKDPFKAVTNSASTIQTYVVAVTIKNGSDVFSPTASDPCDPAGQTSLTRVENSPIFKKKAYTWGGTAIGNGTNLQYTDAFQRAEFWSETNPTTGINPGYHVNLSSPTAAGHVITATVTTSGWPEYPFGCSPLLEPDFATWDNIVQTQLMPALAAYGVGPTKLPIFLLHNTVFYAGSTSNCCILGYHSAFGSPVQTYSVADYDTTGVFGSGVSDISALSHEIAEWMNDPLVNNPTNPWGNIGQVSGCQNNLEVGDPLSGTLLSVPSKGFTYHPQELAFFSWFYHQSPSIAVNGWYSNNNTFKTAAAPCS